MPPRDRDAREPESTQPTWRRYLRFIRPNAAADLDDELRDHIGSTIDELVAHGMTRDAAEGEALRRFGDVARVRREVERLDARHETRMNISMALDTLRYDVRYALRGLRRSVAFTVVAVVSIALGIAANTTVFSVVNALLLRPIPGARADRLLRVYVNRHSPFEYTDLAWLRDRSKSLEYMFGERTSAMSFRASAASEDERIRTAYVTRGYFPALAPRFALGHPFDVDEARDGGRSAVVVLTNSFWQRQFAGDSSVIGRQIIIAAHPVTVVGVLAPEFRTSVLSWSPDVFIPFSLAPVLTGQKLDEFGGSFYTTARLKAGISQQQAEGELRGLMTQLARTDSVRYDGMHVQLDHVRGVNAEERVGVEAGSAFLMVMVAMVLLIACANVANLLLGRAAARRTEMGVRLAIGASRNRLVRQLLTESLLLAVAGGALGFVTAWALTHAIPSALPPEAGIDSTYFAPDAHVVLFTTALWLLTTLLFGVAPAMRAASPDLIGLLKGGETSARRRSRRGALVVAQAALCVILLAVASLFLRSLASSRSVDPGFRADGVVDATVDLGLLPPAQDKAAMLANIVNAAARMPGVRSASLAAVIPLSGSNMETGFAPEGMTVRTRREQPYVYFNVIGPRFFETVRQSLVRGREFLPTDAKGSPRVGIINEAAARHYWPTGDALGKRFHFGSATGPLTEVVGIVRDANYVMPGEAPKVTVYVPLAQDPREEMTLLLRTSGNLASTRRAVWSLLHDVAPTLPPPPVVHMSDDMAITLLPVRLGAGLLGSFGVIALVLAAVGIYGVASYSVSSRRREIGVRAALGATRARLVRMVLWESGRRVGIGAAIGLIVTIAIAFGLNRVLYGIQPLDPLVLGSVAFLIALVAVVAALIPARRAAGADPVSAMRTE